VRNPHAGELRGIDVIAIARMARPVLLRVSQSCIMP